MQISFATQKLQKICNNDKKMRGEFGVIGSERLRRRLDELLAAECLEDLRNLPQSRCHELTGDMKGMLAVDLEHPKRLVFEPDHDPRPEKEDGGLDWQKVTAVRICEIIDYH